MSSLTCHNSNVLSMRPRSTAGHKNQATGTVSQNFVPGSIILFPKTFSNAVQFSKFFTMILSNKFPTKSSLNIPLHLKRVATLPCEIHDTALTHSSQWIGFSVPSCTQKQFTSCDLVPPRIKYTGASTVVLVSSSLACS